MSILNTPQAVTVQIQSLVQSLVTNGLDVPEELSRELELSDSVSKLKVRRDAERDLALANLTNVSPDKFESALEHAHSLWADNDPADDFTSKVKAAQSQRLIYALRNSAGPLMSDITSAMNAVVDGYRLNELSIPEDLNTTFDVMRSSPGDIEAINAFRQAVPTLNQLFGSYKSLAKVLGYEVSQRTNDGSMDTAFIVSDVDQLDSASHLAEHFMALRSATENLKVVQPLGIWGVTNMLGYRIELKSIDDAQYRRTALQNAIAVNAVAQVSSVIRGNRSIMLG